uniref:Plasmolipin n=1 Tax=Ornithorhynchus anatinus TaxID=9258 RepID=A0A6I8NNV9_ORNAN
MSEFPSKVSTQTSTPAPGTPRSTLPGLRALRPDLRFLRSSLAALMLLEMLLIFNVSAAILYITGFITCSASVQSTSHRGSLSYNKRAAASFFACLVMIAYGASAFFSFQTWKGIGSNAATSQMTGTNYA